MNSDIENGLAALEAGEDARARAAFDQVGRGDPEYARAQNLLAQLQLRAGELELALAHARNASAAAPDEFGCCMTQSRVYEALEDYQSARNASRAAIDIDRDSYDAWFLYATQALKMSDYPAAADAYRQAHALAPQRIEALVNLGSALDRGGKSTDALAAYNSALSLQPDDPRILLNIGRMHAAAGDFPAAIEVYRRALSKDPKFADGWINLTVACLKSRDPQQAIGAVQRCLEAFPADRSATSLAMMAYQQLGDMDNYRRLYAFDELIYQSDLEVPPGYASRAAFNEALAAAVLAHPTLIQEPAGKSTRRGRQTGNLVRADASGIFTALQAHIMQHIERFLARSPNLPGHPYTQYAPVDCDFYMWATVLDEQGHQDPHIHPAGWVSGVYYAQIPSPPPATADEQAGWIEFGQPEVSVPGIDESNTDLHRFPPQEGRLFLFPSYFYHRTIPYRGNEPRISIAFDLVPKRLRRLSAGTRPAGQSQLEQQVMTQLRRGRIDEARTACADALGRDGKDPVALAMMGQVMQQQGRTDQAATLFRQSLASDPGSLMARLGLIGQARQSRQHDEALQLANDGVEATGAVDASLLLARADLHIDLGQFGRAQSNLHSVLENTPWSARAAWLLASLGDTSLDAQALGKSLAECPPRQKAGLHFALGRLHERDGDISRSFEHYRAANDDLHQRWAATMQSVDLRILEHAFGSDLYRQKSGSGSDSDAPVFIVGMPRTGTTLVEQLLATHPQVQSIGETDLLWRAVANLARELPAGSQMPADIGKLPAAAIQRAADTYVSWLRRMAGDARCIVDRHLQNHAMLGVIQLMLPNARIIHCRRNEIDTRWSCYANWFDSVVPYAYDLATISAAQNEHSALQRLWDERLSMRQLDLQYEELVADFESQARRILEFCGLAWDPVVLQYHRNPSPLISGDRIGVRQPVYASSVGRGAPFSTLIEGKSA